MCHVVYHTGLLMLICSYSAQQEVLAGGSIAHCLLSQHRRRNAQVVAQNSHQRFGNLWSALWKTDVIPGQHYSDEQHLKHQHPGAALSSRSSEKFTHKVDTSLIFLNYMHYLVNCNSSISSFSWSATATTIRSAVKLPDLNRIESDFIRSRHRKD